MNICGASVLLCLLYTTSLSQNQKEHYCDHQITKSHLLQEKIVNGTVVYEDLNGNMHKRNPVYDMSLEERIEKGITLVSNQKGKRATRANYTLTFLDVSSSTGFGFDDPSLGSARRSILESALTNILTYITDGGSADFEVQLSESDGKGALASATPYLKVNEGFQFGAVAYHIINDKDLFGGGTPDGIVTFDFGYKWNSTTNDPVSDEYDMYTVSLHELFHAFGFSSLISESGESSVGASNYLNFDQFVINSTNKTLIDGEPPDITTSSTDITSEGLKFNFIGSGKTAPIYSPTTYQPGSSVSHFDQNRIVGTTYIMHPSLSKGTSKRVFHDDEVNVLSKIGYSLNYNNVYSVNDISKNDASFSVYPNPFLDVINVNWTHFNPKYLTIQVNNILGKNILKIENNELNPNVTKTVIDLTSFPKGIYFLHLEDKNNAVTRKLIKN